MKEISALFFRELSWQIHFDHHANHQFLVTPSTSNIYSDEIWVEHRSQPVEEIKKEPEISANQFSSQFKVLLESGIHSDITFIVGDEETVVTAHKAVLTARYVGTSKLLSLFFFTLIFNLSYSRATMLHFSSYVLLVHSCVFHSSVFLEVIILRRCSVPEEW